MTYSKICNFQDSFSTEKEVLRLNIPRDMSRKVRGAQPVDNVVDMQVVNSLEKIPHVAESWILTWNLTFSHGQEEEDPVLVGLSRWRRLDSQVIKWQLAHQQDTQKRDRVLKCRANPPLGEDEPHWGGSFYEVWLFLCAHLRRKSPSESKLQKEHQFLPDEKTAFAKSDVDKSRG